MFSATVSSGHEAELLVDHRDAEFAGPSRRLDALRRAVDLDIAGVVGIGAGENPHQGGLAGAVFPDERVNLSALQFKVDSANGDGSNEAFEYLRHSNDGFGRGRGAGARSSMTLIVQWNLSIAYRL